MSTLFDRVGQALDNGAISSSAARPVDRVACLADAAEQEECVRTSELHVPIFRPEGRERIVVVQRFRRLSAPQRDGRQSDVKLRCARIDGETALVGADGVLEPTLVYTHETKRMPHLEIARVATSRLAQARFRPTELTPARSAQASCSRSRRISGSEFSSPIVKGERFVVAMSKFVSMPELDPRDRALRAEPLRQDRSLTRCRLQVPQDPEHTHQLAPLGDGFGMTRQVFTQERLGLSGLASVHEQGRLAVDTWLLGTARGEGQRQQTAEDGRPKPHWGRRYKERVTG